jgi:hypothetical protein
MVNGFLSPKKIDKQYGVMDKDRIVMADAEKGRTLRALWRDKMHVEPRALELSVPAVRRRFDHVLAPADWAMRMLEPFPLGWLQIWQSNARGHLVFTHRESAYRPGAQPFRDSYLESVCYLRVADLIPTEGEGALPSAMLYVLHLLDHLLGSHARLGEPMLSEGGGITPELTDVAERFQRIHALAYGHQALQVSRSEDYFAHTVRLFLVDSRRLNVLDPLVHRLYAQTLFNPAFWQRQSP